jgi:hypothetical protein
MSANNPLRQYFRQPAIYIRLPSQGKFYPEDAILMPPNGELPILPMTAIDEITYRTPDALFNGSAVVNVIQSCVPNIKNAWTMPSIDIDTLLIAIRIASYGNDMDFSSTCPNCSESAERTIDMRNLLDGIKSPDYDKPITQGDMTLYFQPMTYKNLNENNQVQFEEQKILQMLPDNEIANEEKVTALGAALKKITEVTINALSQSVKAIQTPNGFVTEPEYIHEFLENCDRALFNRIRDHIIDVKQSSEIRPVKLECPECKHQYEQQLTLDMTSFFGAAS